MNNICRIPSSIPMRFSFPAIALLVLLASTMAVASTPQGLSLYTHLLPAEGPMLPASPQNSWELGCPRITTINYAWVFTLR